MSAETRRFYEFGKFRLDLDAKTLFCESQPVSLTPKVFDTLLFFVEHAGRLLEKEELMQRLWQDRFVEESNLTFNIKMLRRALNDDAHQPRFIETVPRRGYRFIAEVKEYPAVTDLPTELKTVAAASPVGTTRLYLACAAGLVLVVCASAIALFVNRTKASSATSSAAILTAPFKAERFSNTGSVHAVITPDARYVAYTSESGGKHSVWLRQLESAENIQIVPPTDDRYLGLAISHDGNSLYFVRENNADRVSAIYRVMTFGGIPVKISEKAEGWISVSPDDKQLSFVRCHYHETDNCGLMTVGVDGKNERRVVTRAKPNRISANQFSPDGKSIAFAAGQSSTGARDFRLMQVDLARGTENEIAPKPFFQIRDLEWLPAGDGLLVTASEVLAGKVQIWHVSSKSGEAKALTKDATSYVGLSINKNADKMIATFQSNTFHLFLAAANEVNSRRLLTPARSFTFMPDGNIIYSGDDGDIWTINRDGSGQRQLTSSPYFDFAPAVSADGRYVFFTSNRSGSNQVWRMDGDGSNQIQLTSIEGGYPRFVTPDGKWVYFESGLHQTLWRVTSDGKDESQVAEGRLYSPAFSPDGKLAAYIFRAKEGDTRIGVLSLEDRKVVNTFSLAEKPLKIAWAADNQSINYITTNRTRASLWRRSLTDQKPQLIAELGEDEIEDFAISPDGGSFGFVRGKWLHDGLLIEGLK